MIPKTIHYCWFGKKEKPPLVKQRINDWKNKLPEYDIIEWNEDNFNPSYNLYTQEAYSKKRWAFVSDVARLYALVNYGGIYFDTDVEVIKSLDSFLEYSSFLGFEHEERILTAVLGCEAHHPLFIQLLQEYDTRSFIKQDGSDDCTTNVKKMTDLLFKYGLKKNGERQIVYNIHIFPQEYFSPKNNMTYKLNMTDNSCTIHHFENTWMTPKQKLKKKALTLLPQVLIAKIVAIKRGIRNQLKRN